MKISVKKILAKKKKICALLILIGVSTYAYSVNDVDSLGMPGDNLDLYGALELFKKSASPEEFEKALNTESNEVNNLDLNADGEIDYIRVIDHSENDVHALTLEVLVSETEAQNVAVIEIEKAGNETAHVQIIGDEDLYGPEYIIEPSDDESSRATNSTVVVMNVWAWPSVRYVYAPRYTLWVSPWRWRHYPLWWKPWRPVAWHVHHKRVVRYHVHYRPVHVYRLGNAHRVYHTHRVVSVTYKQRHPVQHRRVQNTKPKAKRGHR